MDYEQWAQEIEQEEGSKKNASAGLGLRPAPKASLVPRKAKENTASSKDFMHNISEQNAGELANLLVGMKLRKAELANRMSALQEVSDNLEADIDIVSMALGKKLSLEEVGEISASASASSASAQGRATATATATARAGTPRRFPEAPWKQNKKE